MIPWTAAWQASLSFTISQSLLKFVLVILSNHLNSDGSFSSCLQSFPASGSFPMSQFFTSGGQSIRASASVSVLPMNTQSLFPLELTDLISLLFKGLSRALCWRNSWQSIYFRSTPGCIAFPLPYKSSLPSYTSPSHNDHWSFYCFHSFTFSRMSYNWKHTVYSLFNLICFARSEHLPFLRVFLWLSTLILVNEFGRKEPYSHLLNKGSQW